MLPATQSAEGEGPAGDNYASKTKLPAAQAERTVLQGQGVGQIEHTARDRRAAGEGVRTGQGFRAGAGP